mmetsp:Transcript_65632/g.140307  ORF Transcript_65632/g.140307 Transcript_65632/m.140307 type:complete len:229 (+) Transcript_65632:1047-1733(+)
MAIAADADEDLKLPVEVCEEGHRDDARHHRALEMLHHDRPHMSFDLWEMLQEGQGLRLADLPRCAQGRGLDARHADRRNAQHGHLAEDATGAEVGYLPPQVFDPKCHLRRCLPPCNVLAFGLSRNSLSGPSLRRADQKDKHRTPELSFLHNDVAGHVHSSFRDLGHGFDEVCGSVHEDPRAFQRGQEDVAGILKLFKLRHACLNQGGASSTPGIIKYVLALRQLLGKI